MRGTKLYWWLRHLSGKAPSFDTLRQQPHRAVVCDAVMEEKPASVFDFGCGSGTNLCLLQERDPKLRVSGVDPVAPAIWTARKHLTGDLRVGGDELLPEIKSKSVDVSLSDAVFFYLPPQKAVVALSHLLRISRRAVILSTWHKQPARKSEDEWLHDYEEMARDLSATVSISQFPADSWNDTRWRRYGALVKLTT